MFNRHGEVRRVSRMIERLESPRLQMAVIVALTGAAGLAASWLMLKGGLAAMWLRYPLAVAIAYAVFLFLLWLWLRAAERSHEERDEYAADAADVTVDASFDAIDTFSGSGGSNSSSDSSGPDFDLDVGGVDLDEGAPIALVIAIVVGVATIVFSACWAMFAIVGAAPVLLAEILVDAALARGLYLRVRTIDQDQHWLRTAVKRTVWRFASVAVAFGCIGALIAWFVPGADSIGDLAR
jgi:hypothetical protein